MNYKPIRMDQTKSFSIIILFLFVFDMISLSVNAQDIHFSQFYNSPQTLNPALTGNFEGDYRLVLNYRRQWASFMDNPFETSAAAFDMPLPQNFIKTGTFAGGLQFFSDKSGLASLSNQTVLFSVSYQRFIDKNKIHQFSGGLQAGIVTKKIDYSNLTFKSQNVDNNLDASYPSGENLNDNSFSYFDLNGGVLVNSVITQKLKTMGGISFFHLTKPNESFVGNNDNKLNLRYVLHGSANYILKPNVNLMPALIIMNQSKAQEINLGATISYMMKSDKFSNVALYFGTWVRTSVMNTNIDAVIPSTGLQYHQWKLGISYDINVSSLRAMSNMRGGPEISIIYIGNIVQRFLVDPILPCLRY